MIVRKKNSFSLFVYDSKIRYNFECCSNDIQILANSNLISNMQTYNFNNEYNVGRKLHFRSKKCVELPVN